MRARVLMNQTIVLWNRLLENVVPCTSVESVERVEDLWWSTVNLDLGASPIITFVRVSFPSLWNFTGCSNVCSDYSDRLFRSFANPLESAFYSYQPKQTVASSCANDWSHWYFVLFINWYTSRRLTYWVKRSQENLSLLKWGLQWVHARFTSNNRKNVPK